MWWVTTVPFSTVSTAAAGMFRVTKRLPRSPEKERSRTRLISSWCSRLRQGRSARERLGSTTPVRRQAVTGLEALDASVDERSRTRASRRRSGRGRRWRPDACATPCTAAPFEPIFRARSAGTEPQPPFAAISLILLDRSLGRRDRLGREDRRGRTLHRKRGSGLVRLAPLGLAHAGQRIGVLSEGCSGQHGPQHQSGDADGTTKRPMAANDRIRTSGHGKLQFIRIAGAHRRLWRPRAHARQLRRGQHETS